MQNYTVEGNPMTSGRLAALIAGALLLVSAVGMVAGGGALAVLYATSRDDAGYLDAPIGTLETPTPAITSSELSLIQDEQYPEWLVDLLQADVHLQLSASESDQQIFVGVGPAAEVATYLDGVAHEEVLQVGTDSAAEYRSVGGEQQIDAPTNQDFWIKSVSGAGTQDLTWEVAEGRWVIVVMNADGSPDVSVDAHVGLRAEALLPIALTLLGVGLLLGGGAIALIMVGASRHGSGGTSRSGLTFGSLTADVSVARPVALSARLDPALSRWRWLIKWILAIPHFFVLVFLWPAFIVATVVAGIAILFTGRYPRPLFEFNRGVLCWSWRVSYYAGTGGVGTDRYPPFSLGEEPDYPATLQIAYPGELSRGLVLVKWWLLAIPHYLILGLVLNGWWGWTSLGRDGYRFDPIGGGILGLLVLLAAVILLISATYPKALFDLIVGFNRWLFRVIAYAALMTDVYPPFRLDQGGFEPIDPPPPSPDDWSGSEPVLIGSGPVAR